MCFILFFLDKDLIYFEYDLLFEAGDREVTINLEVFDDQVSEKEETFILYSNYSESPNENCAITIKILDNDCELTDW